MSKFILALDSSQISEFMRCPLMWYYHYKENLALDTRQRPAPDKGTLVHKLLDNYYTLKFYDPDAPIELNMVKAVTAYQINQETKKLFPTDNGDLETFLVTRFALYLQNWINNDFVLPKGEVSPVELGFSKLLYEDDYVKFIVEGRIDLLNLIQGQIPCWVDHKSQDRISYLYSYTPQFKTYAWATGYEYGIINYFGLQEDKNNEILKKGLMFRRDLIYSPKEMIQEWEQKMLNVFWDIHSLFTRTSKEPEQTFYKHKNDASCAGAFDSNPCQYTNICETFNWDMKQKVKQMKYLRMEPWTPWELKNAK